MNDSVNKLKEEFFKRGIERTNLTVDSVEYCFYFPEKKLCFCPMSEEENNEQTRDKKYFLNLRKKFEELGINLIVVYESILSNKFNIVLNRLLYKLGHDIKNIYARECIVKEMEYKEYKEFMNKYHLMGSLVSKIRVGLYCDDELLCATGFNKPRYNSRYNFEIGRYAVKFGYSIPGNFSKMLNYFVETYKPKSILTYHDSLFGENSVYEQCGFSRVEDSPVGFLWFKNGQIINRRKLWKSRLPKLLDNYSSSLSAHNNLRNNNFKKIWDLGQGKYELVL